MKRSGPQFAILLPNPKTGERLPSLPPRVKRPNPIPQGSGIMDRIKRATNTLEARLLVREGLSYAGASKRLRNRLLKLA